MGARVLVTGGGGFIGSHLAERLLREGYDVRLIDNFSTGRRSNIAGIAEEIDLVEGDLQSYERAHNAVRDCEAVFHQAALPSVPRSVQDPLTSTMVNVVGTLNVLLAARDAGVRRVVFASSSSIYGANPDLPKREDMAGLPIAPYAVSKQAAEGYCRAFHNVYGLETVALRYFNVFGPRQDPGSQYSAVIPRFITAILDGEPPVIYGDGEQSRDFTYIDNAVDANLLAADAPASAVGLTFNVACGERISLNGIVDELRQISGREVEPVHEAARPGDVPHSLADISLAREHLGYEPRVGVGEGLRLVFEHYRDEREREREARDANVPQAPL
jgi:UDP-glucose 4-epimerase